MTATLDDIRAEIEVRHNEAQRWLRAAEHELDKAGRALGLVAVELLAHDRAAEALNGTVGGAPARQPRRDIAALVRDALAGAPQTVEAIAEKIDVRPSQVRAAIERLAAEDATIRLRVLA